jgi:hypothetical protein
MLYVIVTEYAIGVISTLNVRLMDVVVWNVIYGVVTIAVLKIVLVKNVNQNIRKKKL